MFQFLLLSDGPSRIEWGLNRKSACAVCTNGVYAALCDPSRLNLPRMGKMYSSPALHAAIVRLWMNYSAAIGITPIELPTACLAIRKTLSTPCRKALLKRSRILHGFERRSSFKTWLLRVVSNAALDLGRQRRRREKLSVEASNRATSESGRTPEHSDPCREAEESDLRTAVAEALMMLPESQRRTFILHVDGGMSYREVADTMGISIGTVMSRLFYARQKLRGILASRVQA